VATSHASPELEAGPQICELVLEAEDVGRLEHFYRGLGLTPLSGDPDRAWLSAGGRCRLGIWSPGRKEHADRGGRHVHFALSVSRGTLESVAAELRRQGVDVEGPVAHDGGDRSIYLFDPEGNRVELWDYFEDGDGADEGTAGLAG
jgi:catechol-2,3-dioxygenase